MADFYPLGSVQRCQEAGRDVVFHDLITNDYLRQIRDVLLRLRS